MARYTPEQRRVARLIKKRGRQRGETPMEIKAALETGIVESNLRNLNYGDADSKGWRQERASLYKDPTNLNASIDRFYDETSAARAKKKYVRAGDLAADVQRPAAQYRGRYQQVSGEADRLLGRGRGRADGGRAAPRAPASSTTTTTPGVDRSADRRALLASYLGQRNDPDALLMLAQGLRTTQDVPGTTKTTTTAASSVKPKTTPPGRKGLVEKAFARAAKIDSQKLPYQWGGGHGPNSKPGEPLDCSGAVSKVLGIPPQTSGQLMSWGRPGRSKKLTVWANKDHVLLEINGHFWGTSKSNPDGGAGWIQRDQISKEYLSRFVARHPG